MTTNEHAGHDEHPDFRRRLAEHVSRAEPVLAALQAAGWVGVELDPGIDCEVPHVPDAVDVSADVPAGTLGLLRIRARIVAGRAATDNDIYLLVGSGPGQHPIRVLVADTLAESARRVLGAGLVQLRSSSDVGLDGVSF